jgi:hypothetical protein
LQISDETTTVEQKSAERDTHVALAAFLVLSLAPSKLPLAIRLSACSLRSRLMDWPPDVEQRHAPRVVRELLLLSLFRNCDSG